MGFTIPQTPAAPDVAPGAYDATISAVDQINGQYGPQVRIKFVLETGDTLSLYTSAVFNSKSKLWAVVCNVFGREPGPGTAFNSDWLVGRQARVLVGEHQRSDGTTGSKILAVLAQNQPTSPAQPAQGATMPAVPATTMTPPAWDTDGPF